MTAGRLVPQLAREATLAQRVEQELERLILESRLGAGDRLPSERELASQFGVSRTVVREAVRALAAKQLVDVSVGRGTVVRAPSTESAAESMKLLLMMQAGGAGVDKVSEVRHIVENEIAALAAARRTEADLADLAAILEQNRTHLDEPEIYIKSDVEFHAALARATHNELFVIILHSLVEIMIEVRLLTLRIPGITTMALSHHERVLEAVRAGDPEAARTAMDRHMDQAAEALLQAVDSDLGVSVLAVDIGSSRIKALLAGWDGRLHEVRSAATPRQSSEPGERAYPADAVLETVEDLVQGLASSHPGQRVDTLVFSCLGTAMVPTDADGRPLGPALAPLDTRPQAGASVVDALGLGAAELRERTGSDPALPSSLLHLLWWQRQRPDVMERSQRFRSLRGYALAHFCGADAEDPSWASRTMLMDLERGDWSSDILAAAGLAPELLPAIEPSTTAFPLGAPSVERLGLAPGAVAILGAMDNCCSHLGAQGPGRAGLVNIVGTYEHLAGSADLATVRQAARASGAVVHAYLQPERFIGMTRVPIGELLARAAAGHGGALEALLKAVSVEPRGRSLPLDEAAVDAAIRDGVPGGEVVQALLEAAAAVLGRFADAWEALGRPAEPMAVVGGGAGHAAVTQLKANVLRRTLVTLASEQGAGLGALRLAAMARRGFSEGEASALFAHPVKDTFRPGRRGSTAVSSTQGASVT